MLPAINTEQEVAQPLYGRQHERYALASLPLKIDCVCNVPLHEKRKKTRGFDQSEEIAKRISEVTGIPFIPALRRVRNTKTQTKLSEKQRKENMKGAFEKAADVSGNALLVDDVLTTGATAGECATVLKQRERKTFM